MVETIIMNSTIITAYKERLRLGSKGIAVETVGYLVLAVIALILLWVLLTQIAPKLTTAVKNFATMIICQICEDLFGAFKGILCWMCQR